MSLLVSKILQLVYLSAITRIASSESMIEKGSNCGPPTPPYGSTIIYPRNRNEHSNGTVVLFGCKPGFYLVGPSLITCIANSWTEIKFRCIGFCPVFRHIMNGEVIHVSPVIGKAAVEFRCHDKYRLIGRRRLECISGRWSGNIPFCKKLKTCGRLQPPINGNLHGRDTSHGATVSFACFAGFDLFGLRSITCNNGVWSGNVPSCKVMLCSRPSIPINSYIVYPATTQDHHVHGTRLFLACRSGHFLIGTRIMMCNQSGWIQTEFNCIASCPVLGSVKNGIVTHVTLKGGGEVEIKCHPNYTLVGSATLVCSNGAWNDSLPNCSAPCKEPVTPLRGWKSNRDFRHGHSVNFFCYGSYVRIGASSITCNNGTWDKQVPVCKGATSCAGLKNAGFASVDGEYLIYVHTECDTPIKVYCHGMNTSSPKEFITLPSGVQNNYAYIYAKRLPHRPYSARFRCSGKAGKMDYSAAGLTKFRKVRVDLTRLAIDRNDFTFAKSDPISKRIPYGSAGDCFSMHYGGACRRGHFKVDLSLTGLRLKPSVQWKAIGFPPGIEMAEYKKSKDGTFVSAKCGGWCAKCKPTGEMLLEQTVCSQDEDYSSCGESPVDFRARIVGGSTSNRGWWPWQVALKKPKINKGVDELFCGGALISPRWVLTAAHCFYTRGGLLSDGKYKVFAGDHRLDKKEKSQQEIVGEKPEVHENYDAKTYLNDIALIKLKREVKLNKFVRTLCLPSKEEEGDLAVAGKYGYVSGWGVKRALEKEEKAKEGDYSNKLKYASYQIQTNALCKNSTRYTFESDAMFCGGDGKGGNDTCKGDSGGVFVREGKRGNGYRWIATGIVSWGEGCAQENKYGYYTRVYSYIDWINKIMTEN